MKLSIGYHLKTKMRTWILEFLCFITLLGSFHCKFIYTNHTKNTIKYYVSHNKYTYTYITFGAIHYQTYLMKGSWFGTLTDDMEFHFTPGTVLNNDTIFSYVRNHKSRVCRSGGTWIYSGFDHVRSKNAF